MPLIGDSKRSSAYRTCLPSSAARAAGIRSSSRRTTETGPEDEIEGWKYIAPIQKFGHERRILQLIMGGTFAKNSRHCPRCCARTLCSSGSQH